MRAIPTYYNGYKFRSRLEARWAVFFDVLNIKYVYEPDGFMFNDNSKYLVDFYLPDQQVFVEIKPFLPLKEIDEKKVFNLQKSLLEKSMIYKVLVFMGDPYIDQKTFEHSYKILRFDGFTPDGDITLKELKDRGEKWVHCPLCKKIILSFYQLDICFDLIDNGSTGLDLVSLGIDSVYCENCYLVEHDHSKCKSTNRTWLDDKHGWVETKDGWHIIMSPQLMNAYRTARQAQFENGETPQLL